MTFPHPPRSSNRRAVAMVSALVVLAAGVLVAYLLRDRGRSGPPATPSSGTGEVPTAQTPGAMASCEPGQSGPLRLDTQFTATDGSGQVVRYSISLPADYFTACKRYPVLYALHGKEQNNIGFMDQTPPLRKAMDAGVLDQAIIVTPDSFSTGRWENRDTGPAEDNLIKRLIPFIEQNYRVEAGPSHRLLVGFSMGGHGAIRFGLKYPQLFAAVWSVDGAMSEPSLYLPFVEGKTSADFHIIAVGGQLNGARVQTLIDALKAKGIDIPYVYQDREHEFGAFIDEDEKAGWVALKFLQQNLGRPM